MLHRLAALSILPALLIALGSLPRAAAAAPSMATLRAAAVTPDDLGAGWVVADEREDTNPPISFTRSLIHSDLPLSVVGVLLIDGAVGSTRAVGESLVSALGQQFPDVQMIGQSPPADLAEGAVLYAGSGLVNESITSAVILVWREGDVLAALTMLSGGVTPERAEAPARWRDAQRDRLSRALANTPALTAAPPAALTSAAPLSRTECPPTHPIKGNRSTSGDLIYHVPGGAFYDRTEPETCFATEPDALAAGYRRSQR